MLQKMKMKIERILKLYMIRIVIIIIPVVVNSIYTNSKNKAQDLVINVLKKENDSLEADVNRIRANMLVLSLVDDNFPYPKWLKSTDLMMLKLNKSFEDTFLIPSGFTRADYIGHYDYEIWPEEFADNFRESDLRVIRTRRPYSFIETVKDVSGNLIELEVVKYPIIQNGVLLGVAGFSKDINNKED